MSDNTDLSSDSTDLGIIIILIIGLILYILYVQIIISTKFDIYSTKCNPVNLFLKSINSDHAESIKEFSECVKEFGSPSADTKSTGK